MKKILTTLAAVLCCTIITAVFTACADNFDTPILPEEEDNAIADPIVVGTTNALSRFNYNNWREQTTIDIYNKDLEKCYEVNLPWAPIAVGTIPSEYKHPERDFLGDKTTPKWQLAFNLCDETKLPDVNIFGLWDSHGQIMRIYSYLDKLPNQNAKSYFYHVTSSANNYFDPNKRGWMPDSTTIATCGWGQNMGGGLPVPSRNTGEILPITGTLDGELNPGWTCFELNFSTGIAQVKPDDNITFSLLGVQNFAFTGHMDLRGAMNSYGGKITIPGSDSRAASCCIDKIGSAFSTLASAVAGSEKHPLAVGILGGIGAICSITSGGIDAASERVDQSYKLDLNFNITATSEINGSLSTHIGTAVPSPQMFYSALFDNIIKHSNVGAAPSKITTGLWNLKRAPVIYVCNDALYHGKISDEYGRWGVNACFLDPSSIELMFNTDDVLFPISEVDTVRLLAYDFVFTSDKYDVPVEPYYNYYGISKANIERYDNMDLTIDLKDDEMRNLFLNPDSAITVKRFERAHDYNISFGTACEMIGNGMDAYDIMYSPLMPYYIDHGVAVALEVTFKNGDKRFLADRFLPQIKTYSYTQAQTIYDSLSNVTAQQTVAGIPLETPLFEKFKQKALNTVKPMVEAGELPFRLISVPDDWGYINAIVVKEPTSRESGLAIRTSEKYSKNEYKLPSEEKLKQLHRDLSSIDNGWETINARLEKYGMPSLNHSFKTEFNTVYNVQTGEKESEWSALEAYGITLYEIEYRKK